MLSAAVVAGAIPGHARRRVAMLLMLAVVVVAVVTAVVGDGRGDPNTIPPAACFPSRCPAAAALLQLRPGARCAPWFLK